jgi:hypothetical protein
MLKLLRFPQVLALSKFHFNIILSAATHSRRHAQHVYVKSIYNTIVYKSKTFLPPSRAVLFARLRNVSVNLCFKNKKI